MTEQEMHEEAERNAQQETVGDLPTTDFCPECGSLLNDDGECTNEQCSESPFGVEEEGDDYEYEDEDGDDS